MDVYLSIVSDPVDEDCREIIARVRSADMVGAVDGDQAIGDI